MVSRSGDETPKKSGLTPLSEDPDLDRLAEILRDLPPDRQEAFDEWLYQDDTHERGTIIPLDREEDSTDDKTTGSGKGLPGDG